MHAGMAEAGAAARRGLYDRRVEVIHGEGAVTATPCPVCCEREARPRFRVEGVASPIVLCTRCGTGRYEPMPGLPEIRSYYPPDYYGEHERASKFSALVERPLRAVATRHIAFLSRDLPAGARVLDVGCGRGVLLGALADQGFEVHGVELSADAARGADPRAEIRVAPALEEAGYPGETFDQIIVWHVLEHLADPRETLDECRRILRPGGRLIVAVPNFSSLQARWAGPAWFHLDAPRHLFHFSIESLRQLLDDCGLERISEHHFSLRQNPFGWIQSAQNRAKRLEPNALYTLLQRRPEGGALGAGTRAWLWLAFAIGAPFAVALSVIAALLRRGATVHVVARRREPAS